MRSPASIPAAAAGDSSPFIVISTSSITSGVSGAVRGSPKSVSQTAKMRAATTKCVPGPAKIVIARCQIGFAP